MELGEFFDFFSDNFRLYSIFSPADLAGHQRVSKSQVLALFQHIRSLKADYHSFRREMLGVLQQMRPSAAGGGGDATTRLCAALHDYRERFLREAEKRRELHNKLQELRGNIRVLLCIFTLSWSPPGLLCGADSAPRRRPGGDHES